MRGRLAKLWLVSAVIAALAPFGMALALEVPAAPTLAVPIVDQTGTLSQDQINTLADQIATSRKQKDYQVGILLIKSLEGQALEDYSIKVARQWGIGEANKDNGVLLLVAMEDREMRIEVGRGLEGDLTDAEASRIIRNTMRPAFRKGDYYSGISLGVQNIAAQVEGKPELDTSAKESSSFTKIGEGFIEILFLIFFGGAIQLIVWFASVLARSKSWWLGGVIGAAIGGIVMLAASGVLWSVVVFVVVTLSGFLLDWAVSRNFAHKVKRGHNPSWWAGGPWIGGGSSGGGWSGGGSFGGGGFSGGGSSGGW